MGKRLIEAKKQVSHGEWANWLDKNVSFTLRHAQNFMQCAERFANTKSISYLNPTQMIAMLALSDSETETFIETKKSEGTPVEDMTVKTLRQEIKDWKELQAGMNHGQVGKWAENGVEIRNEADFSSLGTGKPRKPQGRHGARPQEPAGTAKTDTPI